MNPRFLMLACLVTATTFAADAPKLPSIPAEPISKKMELLFSDDVSMNGRDALRRVRDSCACP
jgi:hypothetical protein